MAREAPFMVFEDVGVGIVMEQCGFVPTDTSLVDAFGECKPGGNRGGRCDDADGRWAIKHYVDYKGMLEVETARQHRRV